MAHMDVAIGIGRAVVEHEQFAARTCRAQPLVQVDPRPAIEDRRLLGGQARLHREVVFGRKTVSRQSRAALGSKMRRS